MSMAVTQTCKMCERLDRFSYLVPNQVWRAVVPKALRREVICLACFDYLAAAKGVDYTIQTLYFAGDKRCFCFVAESQGMEHNTRLRAGQEGGE